MARVLRHPDLKQKKGIPYTPKHLRELEREGKFPKRFPLAEGGNFYGYLETEIDAYLEARAACREVEAA